MLESGRSQIEKVFPAIQSPGPFKSQSEFQANEQRLSAIIVIAYNVTVPRRISTA